MRIGIIGGTGKEGRGMALRWARHGHQVCIGSRQAERAVECAAELAAGNAALAISGGDNAHAVASAEVVLLSVPYAAHRSTLQELAARLEGKILMDITVPLKPPRVSEVHVPEGQSAALEAQALLGPATRVVATMHHISSAHLADPGHAIDCDVLTCADDKEALATVMTLVGDLGLTAYDAGPLRNAVALEALTPVLLHLNRRYKSAGAGIRITGLK
jgi:NADPH-dependent F420 reductase